MNNALGGACFVRGSADEDTNGIVVGGVMLCATLYYQNRQQSQQFYAENEDELLEIARSKKAALIAENPLIYTKDSWSMRIMT